MMNELTAQKSDLLDDIEIVGYWTKEETPQLHSIEVTQTIDTEEEHSENSIIIKSEDVYVFEHIISSFSDDKRMQMFLKEHNKKEAE